MENNIIGQRLRALREKTKMSQAKFVAAVGGVKQSAYARYELGEILPPYTVLIKFADYHDVSTDYILGRTENPHGKYFGAEALSQETQMEDFIEMCFDPQSTVNERLKQMLMNFLEENNHASLSVDDDH